jgi:hypothetical protein
MKLNISDEQLQIELTMWEGFLSVRLPNDNLKIAPAHIRRVTTAKPEPLKWHDLRCPGTSIGKIKAGTYFTSRGKEFWCVTKDDNYLTLELQDDDLTRIVLSVDDNEYWQQQITEFLPVIR